MPALSRSAVESALTGEAFGQLARFAIAGLGVTLLCVGVYLVAATALRIDPMIANLVSHFTGVAIGYAIHSRWSFRAERGREGLMVLRFMVASGLAFALNSTWVWLAIHALHGPAWLPVPAMLFVTPLASFAINRWWVFGPTPVRTT